MHSMMVSKIPKVAQLIGICLHSLDEGDSPSKFRVSTPALLYKVLPQSHQGGQYMSEPSRSTLYLSTSVLKYNL